MRKDPASDVLVDPGAGATVDAALTAALASATGDHVVAVLALDGMNPFEFSIACEVFGIRRGEVLARMARPRWYDLRVCAPRPGHRIPTPFGFAMTVERGLDDVVTADTVIVPMAPKPEDAEGQRPGWRMPTLPDDDVLEALRRAADNGARMVSFCSGAFVLAEAGLLDGHRATTHWMYLESFRHRYPRVEVVPDVLYVDEGRVLTSAGSASGMDLSLHLVRQDHGDDAADLVARRMVVPPHRDGGQAQYTIVPEVQPGGTPFPELLDWIVEHLHEPLEVSDLAACVAMSDRTFARRFRDATGTTPHQWLTQQRVSRARQLLETTDLTIDAVATRSGLGTAANLRARLRDACGVSPSTYRERFRRR
jgi:AraC family transcriptional activator FtrA